MTDDELNERLTRIEAEINRLKPMELVILRLEALIEKIALGLGVNPNE